MREAAEIKSEGVGPQASAGRRRHATTRIKQNSVKPGTNAADGKQKQRTRTNNLLVGGSAKTGAGTGPENWKLGNKKKLGRAVPGGWERLQKGRLAAWNCRRALIAGFKPPARH